jgi:phosphatidylserine decarboxylase
MAGIAAWIGIAAEGFGISAAVFAAAIALIALGLHKTGAIVMLAALAIALFFRDPDRFPNRTEGVVLSGADGRVVEVSEREMPGMAGVRFNRVSVFMSPLNVHVNRAPIGGEVARIEYTAGSFRAAFRDDASEHNERNLIVFKDSGGTMVGMMQIAGYLARRIVCRLRVRDRIEPAQRIGLIMFGSRVDHFIPPQYRVTVSPGDRVRAGETVLGELGQ